MSWQMLSRVFFFSTFSLYSMHKAQNRPRFWYMTCIYSLTMNWCIDTKWTSHCWLSAMYLKHLSFLEALRKWLFACLLYICVVMCLWTVMLFLFKVICLSPSGVGCELYIHTAPSWQWPLLAPQLSQELLMVTVSSIYLYNNREGNSCLHPFMLEDTARLCAMSLEWFADTTTFQVQLMVWSIYHVHWYEHSVLPMKFDPKLPILSTGVVIKSRFWVKDKS